MHLNTLLKDLRLLASVYVARFIVWRTLRRWRKDDLTKRLPDVDFTVFTGEPIVKVLLLNHALDEKKPLAGLKQ